MPVYTGTDARIVARFQFQLEFQFNLSDNFAGTMEGFDKTVKVELSHEEAYEVLMRCLQSIEQDTPTFHSAIQKLARAIEAGRDTSKKAA